MQDNQNAETSKDELQTQYKRTKRIPFPNPPHLSWDPPSPLYDGYRMSFQGIKPPGRGVSHPSPFSAEVKERVEIHLYSLRQPS
jgi:hypothetical protein